MWCLVAVYHIILVNDLHVVEGYVVEVHVENARVDDLAVDLHERNLLVLVIGRIQMSEQSRYDYGHSGLFGLVLMQCRKCDVVLFKIE